MATIVLDLGQGFSGECTISGFQGYLDAVAIFDSLEVPEPQQGSGRRTAGNSRHADFEVVRLVDSASPSLARACSGGIYFPDIHILLFRMLEGQMVNHMSYKLWQSYITRLERSSEDAEGSVYGPHINDSGETVQPRASAGAVAAVTQQLGSTVDRPASRPVRPSLGAQINPVEVERLWIRPSAVAWSYHQYTQGVLQGNFKAGWHYEEGVDIGESSIMGKAAKQPLKR